MNCPHPENGPNAYFALIVPRHNNKEQKFLSSDGIVSPTPILKKFVHNYGKLKSEKSNFKIFGQTLWWIIYTSALLPCSPGINS